MSGFMSDSLTEGILRRQKQARQDALDGAALRRLREALPDDGPVYVRVTFWNQFEMDRTADMTVGVQAVRWPEALIALAGAHTIAEAADKCREALSVPDER